MIVIRNEKLIKRNGRIGQWTSLAALGVLGVGMYLSFQRPDLFVYSIGALILGFTMTQVGMFFSNRWGRSPRPDEQLDLALKGLPGDTTIYHYVTTVPHLLVGSMGLWVLLPYHQRGQVTYQKNRWRVSGGGFMQAYMTIFGQEGLGRPDLDASSQIESVRKHLAETIDEGLVPPINAALVFSSDKVEITSSDAPVPAVHIRKLKDFMRQRAKEAATPADTIRRVKECLPEPTGS
jgi:hypothetical protein